MWKGGGFQLVDCFVLFFALRLYRAVKSDFYPYCIYFGRKIAKTVVINSKKEKKKKKKKKNKM
jgi:hypothetical protein